MQYLLLIYTFFNFSAQGQVHFDSSKLEARAQRLIDNVREEDGRLALALEEALLNNPNIRLDPDLLEKTRKIDNRSQGTYCSFGIHYDLERKIHEQCQIPDLHDKCSKLPDAAKALIDQYDEGNLVFDSATRRIVVSKGLSHADITSLNERLKRQSLSLTESLKKSKHDYRARCLSAIEKLQSPSCESAYDSILEENYRRSVMQQCSADIIERQKNDFIAFMTNDDNSPTGIIKLHYENYSNLREQERKNASLVLRINALIENLNAYMNAVRTSENTNPWKEGSS